MVAYNFMPKFADDVEHGFKTQTIRREARCKPGDDLQLYTGQRTKECRKLADAICTRVVPVKICDTEMFLDGQRVYAGSDTENEGLYTYDNDFARADGFDGYMEMADWFREKYGSLPFEGFVIYWRIKE